MITVEDKRRICARAFYQDNKDQYEDYHEALAEFMSGQNVSDSFIDTVVEPFVSPEPGHFVVVNDLGHVASVRDSDGFFSPRTEFTQDEGMSLEVEFTKAMDEFPDLDGIPLLEKTGWRVVRTPEMET